MPPAAADQFFTSRASPLMHRNNNNNDDNNTNGSKQTTTLKNLINYNNNNNNNNCLQESRSSSLKSSKFSCGSCLRYQRDQEQPRQQLSNEKEVNSEGLRKTSFDLVHGDFRNMTAVSSDGEHQNPLNGEYHSSKAKSNTHRTPCTNVVNGLSHSYYDCCINVHVSALLDHWLDWPSNHCPPSKDFEKNGDSGLNTQPKKFHAKDGACNGGSMLGQSSNGSNSQFLSNLMSSSQRLPCKTTSSSLSPTFCVGTTDFCQECEGCKLFAKLSNPSVEEDISDSFILEQLASHIGKHIKDQTETLSNIRQYFAAKGCDIINYQDSEGKTLLHYSITGEVTDGEELVRQLLQAGADPNIPDNKGETPLLTTRFLFEKNMYSVAHAIIRILIYDYPAVSGNINHRKVNVNATNSSRGTLLFYAVQHGDNTADVTRLLLNSGSSVWKEEVDPLECKTKRTQKRSPEGLNCSQARNVKSNNDSAFKWYLQSLMRGSTDINSSKKTLYMLCTAMESQQHDTSMGQHIDKAMLELGVAPKINGPLFKKLRAEISPFIAKPQSLRFICIKSIRKSIGKRQRQQMIRVSSPPTKRLRKNSSSSSLPIQTSSYSLRNRRNSNPATTSTAVKSTISGTTISNCKLKLPHKLQQFVCLEEMVVPN